VDDLDRQILRLLQEEGHLSNVGLAHRLGVSHHAVVGRVRRLQEVGAIRGYRAVVHPAALGISVRAIVFVRLQEHDEAAIPEFEEAARQVPGVVSCLQVAGSVDLILTVAVPDLAHLAHLIRTELAGIPGVRQFETSLIVGEAVPERGWPPLD
jgi:Lrp/AsnC family leucine-responsive transcriptional regulator